MSEAEEKRRFPRHEHCAPLTYCHFHATPQNVKTQYHGELLGHGGGGLQFKSAVAIRPGTTLLIKLDCAAAPCPEPGAWEGFRSVTLAEVMWCHPVSEEEHADHLVGVKYYNPYL